MGMGSCIALVTQPTRLEGLVGRWSTKSAAKFRFGKFRAHERARRAKEKVQTNAALALADEEADFMLYEQEDDSYKQVVGQLRDQLDFDLPVLVVEREHLANFLFERAQVVVVVGQDGLLANVAKYAQNLPVIGINPDPSRIDGVLLPFDVGQARSVTRRVLDGRFKSRKVTLAEASLNDGQSMLAFNDFFVGHSGHASARYTLRCGSQSEPQSSSGVIVSTGVGSTGWMSSVLNMTQAIAKQCGSEIARPTLPSWDERKLAWAVREPFKSRHSQTGLVFGEIREKDDLVIESLMPENGVLFSDGISSDYLEFNSGSIARIGVAEQQATLVVPQRWHNR